MSILKLNNCKLLNYKNNQNQQYSEFYLIKNPKNQFPLNECSFNIDN